MYKINEAALILFASRLMSMMRYNQNTTHPFELNNKYFIDGSQHLNKNKIVFPLLISQLQLGTEWSVPTVE